MLKCTYVYLGLRVILNSGGRTGDFLSNQSQSIGFELSYALFISKKFGELIKRNFRGVDSLNRILLVRYLFIVR